MVLRVSMAIENVTLLAIENVTLRGLTCEGSGDADPAIEAVAGSDPPSRHASIGIGKDGDVHPHPPLRCGVAPSQQSVPEGCRASLRGGRQTCWPTGCSSGCPASPTKAGTRSSRVLNGLPAKDRWPGATSRGGWHGRVHAHPPPWHARRHRRGVAPVTPASSRASRSRAWPCRNRRVGSDMGNRGRVR